MDTILAGLDDQVRTNILIFDACRNNPMAPRTTTSAEPVRSMEAGSGLAAPTAPSSGATLGAGTLIAFATAPGQVALDGEGANSPFSAALSRHIGTPGLEVQQMLTRVRAEVVAATKGKQVPWSNSSLLGEVYLAAVRRAARAQHASGETDLSDGAERGTRTPVSRGGSPPPDLTTQTGTPGGARPPSPGAPRDNPRSNLSNFFSFTLQDLKNPEISKFVRPRPKPKKTAKEAKTPRREPGRFL